MKKLDFKGESKMKKFLALILVVALIAISLISCTSSKNTTTKVTHDTMSPLINKNESIIIRKIDAADVKVGDVISFYDPASPNKSVITHRVVSIYEENGARYAITAGDKNCKEQYDRDISIAGDDQEKIREINNQATLMEDANEKGYEYISYEPAFDTKPLKLVNENILGIYTYSKVISFGI